MTSNETQNAASSSSTSSSLHHQPTQPNDYMKLLTNLFKKDISNTNLDVAYEHFEQNITKPGDKQSIINTLLDYYFIYGICNNKTDLINISVANSTSSTTTTTKNIVDLICRIPDELCNKVFDKVYEFLKQIQSLPSYQQQPQQQQSQSLLASYTNLIINTGQQSSSSSSSSYVNASSSNTNHQALKLFEKVTNLLVLLCFKKKSWQIKLITHNLFGSIVKMLKLPSNLNEIISVHISLLNVNLMNSISLQSLNQHLDDLFNSFIYLFKYLIANDGQARFANDEIGWRSVRFSVRLYFYVCYGLYSGQFLQFIKKKDQSLFNKDFLNSIFFYIRLHPALFKEAKDVEKQFKQINDQSIEWRQYCLDPLCTNYNSVIQNMLNNNNTFPIIQQQQQNANNQMAMNSSKVTFNPAPLSLSSISTLNAIESTQQQASPYFKNLPLSPSYVFTSTNKPLNAGAGITSKRYSISTVQNQSSVPNTPTPNLNNSNLQSSSNIFQYPPTNSSISSSSQYSGIDYMVTPQAKNDMANMNAHFVDSFDKNPIRNLTSHFLLNESSLSNNSQLTNDDFDNSNFSLMAQSQVKKVTLKKQKSLSDTNLHSSNADENNQSKSIPAQKANQAIIAPTSQALSNEQNEVFDQQQRAKPAKSEPAQSNVPNAKIDSSTNTSDNHIDDASNLSKMNLTDDVITGYFLSLNNESKTPTNNDSNVAKLKQDLNHLVIQLMYERHLRNKYEEESNRLHFIKIERDQLHMEKVYLEKNLKQLVEQYKNEVETCLNLQKTTEIDAYQNELNEKNTIIENLQLKLNKCETEVNDWSKKYHDMEQDYKKLEKDYGTAVQSLEREKHLKAKNEIDANYIKSLRYTTDLLRKKLLLISKSQHDLIGVCNQEFKDLALFYNNTSSYRDSAQLDDNQQLVQSNPCIDPLYQYQQATIDAQRQELEKFKCSYNKLLTNYNELAIELEETKRNSKLKDTKLDELNQTLDIEVPESIKTHIRIQSSLNNVNKRLEEEILKLKALLSEQTLKNNKLVQQISNLENREDLTNKLLENLIVGHQQQQIKSKLNLTKSHRVICDIKNDLISSV